MNNHYKKYYPSECNMSMQGDTMQRCGATLWAPSLEPHFVEDRAFTCYAMECEGDLPTRKGKINKVIKLLSAAADPNDFPTQCRIYDEVGIDSDTFTDEEVDYIQKEVARRCL